MLIIVKGILRHVQKFVCLTKAIPSSVIFPVYVCDFVGVRSA
jgi:hypothetical protein